MVEYFVIIYCKVTVGLAGSVSERILKKG